MRIAVALAAMACAAPAAADDSGAVDYEALFAANVDSVEEISATRQRLTLPGNITVWADGAPGDRRFSAMDDSPSGAAGCFWRAYTELSVMHATCPDLLTEDQAAILGITWERIGDFVADNTFPAVERSAFWDHWEVALTPDPALQCDTLMDPSAQQLVNYLLDPSTVVVIANALTEPRLPVVNPCF